MHAMSEVRRHSVGECSNGITLLLDEHAREGARRMTAITLEAEVDEYVRRSADELDEDGHRLALVRVG